MRLVDADELYKLPCVHGAEGTWICLEDIRNIPTVDAEPVKRGHWIMKPNGYGTCSNCKRCSLDLGCGVDSNYCPNCGAKMTPD